MDVCPEDQVTVAVVTLHGAASNTRFFTVSVDDTEETSERILRQVGDNK
jgi:hypothetical protein